MSGLRTDRAVQHYGVIDRGRGDIEPVHGLCKTCMHACEQLLFQRYPPKPPAPIREKEVPLFEGANPRPIRKPR